jgi:hypothetical protein
LSVKNESPGEPRDDACRELHLEQVLGPGVRRNDHRQPQEFLAGVGVEGVGRVGLDEIRDGVLHFGLAVELRQLRHTRGLTGR